MGHARALVNIEKPQDQLRIFNKIIEQELSVRKVEELVRLHNMPTEDPKPKAQVVKEYESLKQDLVRYFNSRVEFKRDNNGTGKIVIPFQSDEDLERIIAIFDKLNT